MRRSLLRKTSVTAAVGGALLWAFPVLAQVDLGLEYATTIGLGTTDIRTTIGMIISYFLGLLGLVAVVIMLYAGFLWMTAGGNEEKVSKAKRWMINGVIGLVIILSAYAITSFIFRAIEEGTGVGLGPGDGGCPPGQVCTLPGDGGSAFSVTGVVPAGPGPNDSGWPKNYAITVGFNAAVSEASVTADSVEVRKCNPRLDGSEQPQPFDEAACTEIYAVTRTVEGSKIVVKPSASAEEDPTDFDGEYWYRIRMLGGQVKDTRGRVLFCPFRPVGEAGDISSPQAQSDLCERAVAFNNLRDVSPPTVSLNLPLSRGYCPAGPPEVNPTPLIPIQAVARDDFLPAAVDFQLSPGGAPYLVNAALEQVSSVVNGALVNPFMVDEVFVNAAELDPGDYDVSVVAHDGVPQSSEPAQRTFRINVAHCCNGELDADETGVDCGGADCSGCSGDSCTSDLDCASGYCNPETGRCEEKPEITLVDPSSAGPGSLITITGEYFGRPGNVTFMGADVNNDGDPDNDGDEVTVEPCSGAAWTSTEVTVVVPQGAVTGHLKLTTASGAFDRTDDGRGWEGPFNVTADVLPGICFLEPSTGGHGTTFVIHGSNFGLATNPTKAAWMDGVELSHSAWTETEITADAPATLSEGNYQVRVAVSGTDSNTKTFALRVAEGTGLPNIVSITPDSGPKETYITIRGSGFGHRPGTVYFTAGSDQAMALEPACADYWHSTYIVVKVPIHYSVTCSEEQYDDPACQVRSNEVVHQVMVETAAPGLQSNTVSFTVNNDPLQPGICSMSPDNGPAGIGVSVSGEGFGPGPYSPANPENTVRFYLDAQNTMAATVHGEWSDRFARVNVPGDVIDIATWPQSGPVHLVADNTWSSNSIPFTVQDCNQGGTCAEGTTCCADGACKDDCVDIRDSSFAWNFSTNVLPALPRVVERGFCDVEENIIQSPNPYKRSQDACINARLAVEFNQIMEGGPEVLNANSIKVRNCGQGTEPDCDNGSDVPTGAWSMIPDGSYSIFKATPDDPEAAENLVAGTWYRVTLVSDPENPDVNKRGFRDVLGRYLDGDMDRRQGGNYVWTFRTGSDRVTCNLTCEEELGCECTVPGSGSCTVPNGQSSCQVFVSRVCELDSTVVQPGFSLIEHEGEPRKPYDLGLVGANCNLLQCVPGAYVLDWAADEPDILDLEWPDAGSCELERNYVTALQETDSGATTELYGDARSTEPGALTKRGTADVRVKFKDPIVVAYAPNCEEACVNAAIYADFNVSMDRTTLLTPGNVELFRCRNASCLPPFEQDLGNGATRTLLADDCDPVDGPKCKRVLFESDGTPLLPSTWYRVRIRSGEDGVLSSSGVPLTGLNEDPYFTWIFRTKDDGNPCAPSRVTLTPETAILFYIGQRLNLQARPFGAPDECDPKGQLLSAYDFDWGWSFAPPNQILKGFVDGDNLTLDTEFTTVDTSIRPADGCTGNCRLTGSQTAIPQCGNGRVEDGEDCDGGAGCDPTSCLYTGMPLDEVSGCGNGDDTDEGEACDKVYDPELATDVFPPGCKDPTVDIPERPELNGLGCVMLGSSSVAGAVCGNGELDDGEMCDIAVDSRCSRDCLHEGTLPSCLEGEAGSCINYCGNGLPIEPGEDPDCETGGAIGSHCNSSTCLKTGLPPCRTTDPDNELDCCGNGDWEDEEDFLCDIGGGEHLEFCTDRCLLKGSSAFYDEPSFCGDGLLGVGEYTSCDAVVGTGPDGRIDARQVVETKNPVDEEDMTTRVLAGTLGVSGEAEVILSCTCDTVSGSTPDEFCAGFDPDLACGNNGCCAPRPEVSVRPTGQDECRNTPVTITFDRLMERSSLERNILVEQDLPGGCGEGVTGPGTRTFGQGLGGRIFSFLYRLWEGFTGALHRYLIRPVFGQTYCPVEGTLSVTVYDETETTVVTFSPTSAFESDTAVRVTIGQAVETVDGVGLSNDWIHDFGTGQDICTIRSVAILPESLLLTSVNQAEEPLTAQAYSRNEAEIVPTLEYDWDWEWTPQPEEAPVVSSVVLYVPDVGNAPQVANVYVRGKYETDLPEEYEPENGSAVTEVAAAITCTLAGDPCAEANGCECIGLAGTCQVADGDLSCVTDRINGRGEVTVLLCDNPWPSRKMCGAGGIGGGGGSAGDSDYFTTRPNCTPATYYPFDTYYCTGNPIPIFGTDCDQPYNGGICTRVGSPFYGQRMNTFCDWQACYTTVINYSWYYDRCCVDFHPAGDAQSVGGGGGDFDIACTEGQMIWYPFFDPDTNFSFYYCRDSQAAGDNGRLLPALKEDAVKLDQPAPDVFREYLFTYVPESIPPYDDIPGRRSNLERDAFGIRISFNKQHQHIADWYAYRFAGSAQALQVDGYDALRQGRTVYVNAAAKSGDSLYTNINVLSHSDGAAPETANIYEQILKNIDFNRNEELKGTNVCKLISNNATVLDENNKVTACTADVECGADAYCDAPKDKLTRDVRRWSDLTSIRDAVLSQGEGKYPTVQSGSFLRGRTNSVWSSWFDVLGAGLAKDLPIDPLNRFAACTDEGYDLATCWNATDQTYLCPLRSHVYDFKSIGADRAEIGADFEYSAANVSWGGETCIEQPYGACPDGCEALAASGGHPAMCQYPKVTIMANGVITGLSPRCSGNEVGEVGYCGDGIVQAQNDEGNTEVCELGQIQVVSCQLGDRFGTQTDRCNDSCTAWIPGDCDAGRCGDGVVQQGEDCDDGDEFNGKYGYCNATCDGLGPRCGDLIRQPNEVCDCGGFNGVYKFNAIVQQTGGQSCSAADGGGAQKTPDSPSCAWDCSGVGPRCGDGIVNGAEVCDGGREEYKGICTDYNPVTGQGTGCDDDADCPQGTTCGNFCGKPEQRRIRTCNANDPSNDPADDDKACRWGSWACTSPGACGNGVKETGEECDDGNDLNTDGCTNDCALPRCGDGYHQPASGEQCDDGPDNNQLCTPEYNRTCHYCTSSCRLGALSGGFCGNGLLEDQTVDPPGPEECDGPGGVVDYVCVSSLREDQSFGRIVGEPFCDETSCTRVCENADSYACYNPAGGANYDGGAQPGDADACLDIPSDRAARCNDSYYTQWTDDDGQVHDTYLVDTCDPDIDNDGVPNKYDCDPQDDTVHGSFTLYPIEGDETSVQISAATELCDNKDNDCNGIIDDSWPVDMAFSIDISGSMDGEIDDLAEGISMFANEFTPANVEHRFGFVSFGQSNNVTLDEYVNHATRYRSLTDAGTFLTALNNLNADGGGAEHPYASVIHLTQAAGYQLGWRDGSGRDDAKRYIVVLTDEPQHYLSNEDDELSDVLTALNCPNNCGIDSEVNVFGLVSTWDFDEWWTGNAQTSIVKAANRVANLYSNPTSPITSRTCSYSCPATANCVRNGESCVVTYPSTSCATATQGTCYLSVPRCDCSDNVGDPNRPSRVRCQVTPGQGSCTWYDRPDYYRLWLRCVPFRDVCAPYGPGEEPAFDLNECCNVPFAWKPADCTD